MRVYCTLFDRNYLTRALVLYRTLARVSPDFRLLAFCMDESSAVAFRRLALPSVEVVPLAELERHDPALRSTKETRTQVEYCWTATPAVCRYVLETSPETDAVTYLDADLQFFSNPEPLFEEFADGEVLIVPHRYAPEYRHKEATSGTYNVEWLTFRRSPGGLAALHWWHERCIEWCYFRWEDGKLGDQKYLDEFPRRFDGVRVLQHPGGGLAPWNVTAHRLTERNGRVSVDGRALVFYHHHSLRLYRRDPTAVVAVVLRRLRPGVPPLPRPWRTNYPVAKDERGLIWDPYLGELGHAHLEIGHRAPGALPDDERLAVEEVLRPVVRHIRGRGRAALRTLDPVRFVPGRWTRYRDSWRSHDVARQMVDLTNSQLENPDDVPPYRAFREILSILVAAPEMPRPARFLDIGAGAGGYSELLDRWAPEAFDYTGADYAAEIVSAAQARWPDRRFLQRDLFVPGSLDGYDVVFASAVLDVIADVERALDSLLGADARWVILHRQRVGARRSHVEIVGGYRGQRTYATYVTESELAAAASRHGRNICASVEVDDCIRSFVVERPC